MGIRDNVSADEYAKLEALAAANKDEWEALLQEKRNHWKELKEKGMLEKLTSKDVYMEDIDEIEDYGEQLIRSRKGSLKGALWDDEEEEEETINPIKKELIEKMKIVTGKQGSALAIYNLLNEMKDKGLLDATLVEEAILSMTKHDSDHYAVSSYKLHKKVTSVFGTISCTKSHQYADSIFLFLFCAQICANLTTEPHLRTSFYYYSREYTRASLDLTSGLRKGQSTPHRALLYGWPMLSMQTRGSSLAGTNMQHAPWS